MSTKKVTSFTHLKTAEGNRLSFTYSEISDIGELVKSNERKNIIVVDDDINTKIEEITCFLNSKLESQ